MAQIKCSSLRPHVRCRMVDALQNLRSAGERLGIGHALRHHCLMVESGVLILEGRNHGKDGLTFLVGLDSSCGERPSIMDPVDGEGDFFLDISGSEEIPVEGVNDSVLSDRVHGPNCGLGHDLSSKDSAVWLPLTRCREDIFTSAR